MKKSLEFLLLLCPMLLWGLSTLLLSDQFVLPNRLLLAVLCTATGAAALYMNRRGIGAISLIGGLIMLAAIPIDHEVPTANISLNFADYELPGSLQAKPTQLRQALSQQHADLLSLKAGPSQAAEILSTQDVYPYSYNSCTGDGRSILSRFPLLSMHEQHLMGATQLQGQLLVGDTAVDLVVMDFSGVHSELQARQLSKACLQGLDSAALAIIDTGGTRLPMEWISYNLGFSKSQAPVPAFKGTLLANDNDYAKTVLYSPQFRCRSFERSDSGLHRITATYQLGS